MPYLCIDQDGTEWIFEEKPDRADTFWNHSHYFESIELPKGSIEKLIGRQLTWEEGPVELK